MFPNLNAPAIGVHANLPETIDLAQAHGFEGVDFSISELAGLVDTYGLDDVQDLFAAANIRPGSWDFPVNFRQDQVTWHLGHLLPVGDIRGAHRRQPSQPRGQR